MFSSIADISTWAHDYFGNHLSNNETMPVKTLLCQKERSMLTVSRGTVDFSEPRGIWSKPSHSGNVLCGHMNQYSMSFLEEMEAVCCRPVMKGNIKTYPGFRVCHGMGLCQCLWQRQLAVL